MKRLGLVCPLYITQVGTSAGFLSHIQHLQSCLPRTTELSQRPPLRPNCPSGRSRVGQRIRCGGRLSSLTLASPARTQAHDLSLSLILGERALTWVRSCPVGSRGRQRSSSRVSAFFPRCGLLILPPPPGADIFFCRISRRCSYQVHSIFSLHISGC